MEVNENKIKILVSDKLISYSEFKMQQEKDEELIDYIQLIGYPLAEALIIKQDSWACQSMASLRSHVKTTMNQLQLVSRMVSKEKGPTAFVCIHLR